MTIDVSMSARMGRRDELRRYRRDLAAAGYRVVSSWLDRTDQDEDRTEGELAELHRRNLEDIDKSTMHITFSEDPGVEVTGATRGTRHFDAGYASSICRLVVVGPRENAAYCEPGCDRYETWDEFFEDQTGMKVPPETDDDLGLDPVQG